MGQAVPPSQRSCDTPSSHPWEAVPQAELRDGVLRELILLLSQAAPPRREKPRRAGPVQRKLSSSHLGSSLR